MESPSQLTQVTPDLWISRSAMDSINSGIWLRNGTACLVNPGVFPGEIAAIRAFLESRQIKPQYVILTHFHVGHLLGARAFPDALLIAQANFAAEAARQGPMIHKILNQQQWGSVDEILPVPPPAIQISEGSSLYVDDLVIQLFAAPSQALDQLLLYQPDSATLWAGDLLHELQIPYLVDGVETYNKILDLLASYQIRTLVPAHGQPTSDTTEIQRRLTRDRAYVDSIRTTLADAIAHDLTLEETLNRCAAFAAPYPTNQELHRTNVASTYVRLGGKVEPGTINWLRG
jgi:hydroxyacylglutathione hydrolase